MILIQLLGDLLALFIFNIIVSVVWYVQIPVYYSV